MPSTVRQAPPWIEHTLRQAAALAGVPGLPPDALLCVRHLHARLDTQRLRHVGGLLGAAETLSRQLQRHAGDARHPAREMVPESAQAVLFDTPAELLASAARDGLDGRLNQHWWWRSLLDGGALARGAVALWQRQPRHIAAALVELGTRAGEFCQGLAPADAETLYSLLLEGHAPAASIGHPDSRLRGLASADPRRRLLTLGLALASPPGSPRLWPEIWPEIQMTADSRRLSATPKTDQPATGSRHRSVHSSNSASSPPEKSAGNAAESSQDTVPKTDSQATDLPHSRDDALLSDQHGAAKSAASTPALSDEKRLHSRTAHRAGRTADAISDERPKNHSSPDAKRSPITGTPRRRTPIEHQASTLAGPECTQAPPSSRVHLFPHPGEWIETRYGGVLYLLNVALHLGFYPDFTQPRDSGLTLSPWTFIAQIGERLAGRRLRRDALWQRLVALAAFSADFSPAPCGSSPETVPPPEWPEVLRPYLERTKPYPSTPANSWADWFDTLIPPLRRRLAAALAVSPRQSGRLLCRQNARIQFRHGHLEAHFPLNEHPIAIRLAGLDRDPGWIPAAGCDIRFFYDD